MKRSELKMTGETYRLTPTRWGKTYIMIDEDMVLEAITECFGEPLNPDDDPNDLPDTVDIATDGNKNFYAILHPYLAQDKTLRNENLYRKCGNPTYTHDGAIEIYGNWEIFDDED